MILVLEIGLTIVALFFLFTGRTWDKEALVTRNYRFRILGAVLLTFWPTTLIGGMALGIFWALTHPGISEAQLMKDLHWPAIGIEAGLAFLYAIVGHFWHKGIVRKLNREHAARQAPPVV